ncbi:MAG: hypothetical protein JRI68_11755, partial [Deltaproteobacteria bacterium]|nr:hypothetical protein [Deltaproteobacteria bacterium]
MRHGRMGKVAAGTIGVIMLVGLAIGCEGDGDETSTSTGGSTTTSSGGGVGGVGGVVGGAGGVGGVGGSGGGGGAPPGCTNSVQDGDETDVDCGGDTCPACADGLECLTYTDCESRFCDPSGGGGNGGAGGSTGGSGGSTGGAGGSTGGAGGSTGGSGGA